MNYLVDLYLARPTAADRLGSLLGDDVKGPLDGRYSTKITAGIVRHRGANDMTPVGGWAARMTHPLP
ncbi:MAG: hypothetical protein K0A93_03900 [Desulfuromonadaceae bacterium]|nr:hypothetical protein [Desulfuromonadaceae bacterium]